MCVQNIHSLLAHRLPNNLSTGRQHCQWPAVWVRSRRLADTAKVHQCFECAPGWVFALLHNRSNGIAHRWVGRPHLRPTKVRSVTRQQLNRLTCPMCRSRILLEYVNMNLFPEMWLIIGNKCQYHVSIILTIYFCSWINKYQLCASEFRNSRWNISDLVKVFLVSNRRPAATCFFETEQST